MNDKKSPEFLPVGRKEEIPAVLNAAIKFNSERDTSTKSWEVVFDYLKADGTVEDRKLVPYSAAKGKAGWLVTGYDLDVEATRRFKVENIIKFTERASDDHVHT